MILVELDHESKDSLLVRVCAELQSHPLIPYILGVGYL
jgi:hypothetical protein